MPPPSDGRSDVSCSPSPNLNNNPFPLLDPTPYAVGLQPQYTVQQQYTSVQPQFTSFNPYQQQMEQEAAQVGLIAVFFLHFIDSNPPGRVSAPAASLSTTAIRSPAAAATATTATRGMDASATDASDAAAAATTTTTKPFCATTARASANRVWVRHPSNVFSMILIKPRIDPTTPLHRRRPSARPPLNLRLLDLRRRSTLVEHTSLILQLTSPRLRDLHLPTPLNLIQPLNRSMSRRGKSWEKMKRIWRNCLRIGMMVKIRLETLVLCGMCCS
jgi:hypothetical protein